MSTDYIVRVDSVGIPKHKGITKQNIEEFGKLLQKPSDFSKWYIKSKSKSKLYDMVKNCDNCDIAKKLNSYYESDIFNKNDVMVGGSNVLAYGGILFLLGIVYYLFSRNNIKSNALYKLNNNQRGGTIKVFKGGTFSTVYIVSKSEKTYALKIGRTDINYSHEIKIYGKLNKDPKLNSFVVKAYGGGSIPINQDNLPDTLTFEFFKSIDSSKILYELQKSDEDPSIRGFRHYSGIYGQIMNYFKEDSLNYIITDYDENFKSPTTENMRVSPEFEQKPVIDKSILFENIIKTLLYMNVTYDFAHNDLHELNILLLFLKKWDT